MPKVHVISLKVGTSHGLWQYKIDGTHDRIILHGLRRILYKTSELLGFGGSDRSIVYLFYFSANLFEGFQVCLNRIRETSDGGCYYGVGISNIGNFKTAGLFPTEIRSNYFGDWPVRIYFRLEKSLVGGIQS